MAAGKGTRMKSRAAKPLHRLGGETLLQHVINAAARLGADRIVVITGYGAEAVEATTRGENLKFVRQMPQLGTGHAVQQAVPCLLQDDIGDTTLILNGDVPLIETDTARALVDTCGGQRLALLTVEMDDPVGYGRVVRGDPVGRDAHEGGRVHAIVEHKDATPAQRMVREVYTGMMAAPTATSEALAGGAQEPQCAGRVLPHRRRRDGRFRRRAGGRRAPDEPRSKCSA